MTGHIKQITTGRGRKYVHVADDGTETTVPSVTTILGGALPKDGLQWWGFKLGLAASIELSGNDDVGLDELYDLAKKTDHAPHKALTKAGNRGTSVHAVAESLLRDKRLDQLDDATVSDGYVDALVKWHDDFGVSEWEILAVEKRLFSTTHLYAGTVDFIAQRPDGTYIVGDHKTSKSLYQSHHLQTTAYIHAAKEMGVIPADAQVEGHVIRLGEDGEYEVERSACEIGDFLKVLAVFHLLRDKTRKAAKLHA